RAEGVVAMDQMRIAPLARPGPVLRFGRGRRGNAFGDDLFARLHLAPKRGDLDDLRTESDVCQPEAPTDDPTIPEQLLDLIRMRRRADVEIFRTPAEQQVADAAADEVRDVIELAQSIQNLEGVGIDVAPGDGVFSAWNDPRLGHVGIVAKPLCYHPGHGP